MYFTRAEEKTKAMLGPRVLVLPHTFIYYFFILFLLF